MTLCDEVILKEENPVCTAQSCVYKTQDGKCLINYQISSDFAMGVNTGNYENSKGIHKR